jgi:hypothetical protein
MIKLVIWVTSACNLSCPLCMQAQNMKKNKGYSMSKSEIDNVVNSCLRRGFHFRTIELTGGECTLWKHLEYGYSRFCEIADIVMVGTNGNNPQRIIDLGMKTWMVSSSQATPEQLAQYEPHKDKITFNGHSHKQIPVNPIGTIPAKCTIRNAPNGEPQNSILYLAGNVYYCCNVPALEHKTPITADAVCKFEDDFIGKFIDKKYDMPQCAYCLCNSTVWEKIL